MTLYYLPLEPLENRYTKDWFWQFDVVFRKHNIDFVKLAPDIPNAKTDGKNFLDWNRTFQYKFEQMKMLFQYDLKDGDIIFVADGEFPGLESLEYYRKMSGKKFRIYSIWHAGTYDQWDLTYTRNLTRIGAQLEPVLFDICDKVFVATTFHKDLIISKRMVNPGKVYVTGLPVDLDNLKELRGTKKDNDIVFGGRLSYEKGLDIVKELKERNPSTSVVIAQDNPRTREEWLNLLSRSQILISPSRQETFGYCTMEAIGVGTLPVTSKGLAFSDYIPNVLQYKLEDFIAGVMYHLETDTQIPIDIERYHYREVITKMLEEMELI